MIDQFLFIEYSKKRKRNKNIYLFINLCEMPKSDAIHSSAAEGELIL